MLEVYYEASCNVRSMAGGWLMPCYAAGQMEPERDSKDDLESGSKQNRVRVVNTTGELSSGVGSGIE